MRNVISAARVFRVAGNDSVSLVKTSVCGIFVFLALSVASYAGDIQGVVRSVPSGNQVVTGARVTAHNLTTGQKFNTTTSTTIYQGGWYIGFRFYSLPNGTYTISAQYYNPRTRRWEAGSCTRCCTLRRPQDVCHTVIIVR